MAGARSLESKIPDVDITLMHERYVETLLHSARAHYMTSQLPEAEELWKLTISHCMKHMGRDSDYILVASNGLAEFHLEQLRLSGAWSFISRGLFV